MASSSPSPPCPSNSFTYNASLCACNPGYFFNATAGNCQLFRASGGDWTVESGVDYSVNMRFAETILSFNSLNKFTQSQAVFLQATFLMLLSWLAFCFFFRLLKLRDGRSFWFRIRWWISRLDIAFATRHWLDDQKVVMKRKTELGGILSIASWILFIGLVAALIYQVISDRSIEVHSVRAINAPDLASFSNDMEFNITTVSSMSCSHLSDIGTLVVGNPGFIDSRVAPLSTFANYSCHNTTNGPTMIFKCNNCQLIPDGVYISWQFVDLPNNPATAVAFQFNLSAKDHGSKKHMSFISGILQNGSNHEDKPFTYRGTVPNILKFNLFPQIYHNVHDLKLIQPLFHEFLPGSSYSEISQLQASLQSSTNGLINITLFINYHSPYVVEIDTQNVLGPVSFFADLGGLYCISIGIFFFFLVQFEYRIKKLRNEDSVMRKIRSRQKAQDRWDKLRKYVMYTWGCNKMDDCYNDVSKETCCTTLMIDSLHKSSLKRSQQKRKGTVSFNRKIISSSEKVREGVTFGAPKNGEHQDVQVRDVPDPQVFPSIHDSPLPPPPSIEIKDDSEISMSNIRDNLQKLYEYNIMLRERLIATESILESLQQKPLLQEDESQGVSLENNSSD